MDLGEIDEIKPDIQSLMIINERESPLFISQDI